MLNKNMLLVSGVAAIVGTVSVVGVSKAVKCVNKFTDRKRKETEFFNVLKECIEEEVDHCINIGIIDKSIREKVIKQIFEGTKKFVNDSGEEDRDKVLNMSPEEQKRQLTESIKKSRVLYVMNEFCA